MKRYLPVIILLVLLAAVLWSTGCTSASPAPAKAKETAVPSVTSPTVPVPKTTVFGGITDKGKTTMTGRETGNT